jgi:glycerol uptake facilitator-like aquaporin
MSARELRRLAVEALGTGVLSALVIGAGLLAERFPAQTPMSADWLVALTGGVVLAALMVTGGRFNPALMLADVMAGRAEVEPGAWRAGAQVAGAILGVMAAHAVFDMGAIQHGGRPLTGAAVWAGEAGATFVFVLAVTLAMTRGRLIASAFAGLTLAVVYLATPAMSLANPALLIARTLTDSHLGVSAAGAAILLGCQLVTAALAGLLSTILIGDQKKRDCKSSTA